jgi:hypothetical protein
MPTLESGAGRTLFAPRPQRLGGPVQVVPIESLMRADTDLDSNCIVVDALDVDVLPLPAIARAVHWQRRLGPRGRVVLAVSQAAVRSLVASGLHTVLPHRLTLDQAIGVAAVATRAPDRALPES